MTAPNELPPDIQDLFGNLFGEFFGQPTAPKHDGPDITLALRISDDEAAQGVKREVQYKYAQACVACGARGSQDPDAVRIVCKDCNGAGAKQMAQGFFTVQTICGTCRGARDAIANPCGACAGAGKTLVDGKLAVIVPPDVKPGTTLRIPERGNVDCEGKRGVLYITLQIGSAMVSPLFGPPQPQLPQARVVSATDPKSKRAAAEERKRWILSVAAVFAFAVLAYLMLNR